MHLVTRVLLFVGLGVGLAVSSQAAPKKKKVRPIAKLDRMRAVGAPVLDQEPSKGVYVWLEDGWFHVAAASGKKRGKNTFRVTLSSTKPIKADPLDFRRVMSGTNRITLEARVGQVVAKGRIKTEGNISVSAPHALFVGPLSQRASNGVRIGRFGR